MSGKPLHPAPEQEATRVQAISWSRCPACDGPSESVKCKLVCTRCHAIIENCSGD